jgi:ubiquinone/menaquinone biosynthesis C-methylase UbiE
VTREAPPFTSLASVYDAVMQDVEYEEWCDFVLAVLEDLGFALPRTPSDLRVLDLACGTGNSTFPLWQRGFTVAGLDASEEMLAVARPKMPGVPFYEGRFTSLDIGTEFGLVTCVFDSLNNLTDERDLLTTFGRVREHLAPEGWFVFDANTRNGVADLWDEGVFEGQVETVSGPVHYRWTHHYDPATELGHVTAYWSGPDGEHVERHSERGYDAVQLARLLSEAGFSRCEFREYPDGLVPDEDTARLWCFARR